MYDPVQLLGKFNILQPNITSTDVKEEDNKINYLELKITSDKYHLKFSMYRKPPNTSLIM